MPSAALIIGLAFATAAPAAATSAGEDSFFDSLADNLVEKLWSRESPVSALYQGLENTTLGKSASPAPQMQPTSLVALPKAARAPTTRVVPPMAHGFHRGAASKATTHHSPAMSSRAQSIHGFTRPVRSSYTARSTAEECDPSKMVCTSDAGAPHGPGGVLTSSYVESEEERKKLVSECTTTIELSDRQACDVSLLITGAFSPLTGFMKKADYDSVVSNMRLSDGTLFGLPVVLDIKEPNLQGKKILLSYKGTDMAVMDVEEEWEPEKSLEAEKCYGTASDEHPTVFELQNKIGKYYAGGKVSGLITGFVEVWGQGYKTPAEVRATLPEGKQVVAFQNRNPVHKAHFELLVNAKEDIPNSIVFVHPTCGPTQPGDIDGPTRIKTYEVLQEDPFYKKWAGDSFRWSYLPYSMKMAGPREAIQHMIIRKNFGATHFIIGRDMAGTKSTKTGDDFYGPFDAQLMGEKYGDELAMKVAKYPNMVYVGEGNGNPRGFATEQDAKDKGLEIKKLSGTKFRDALRNGEDVPEWFAFPAVVKTLQEGGDKIFVGN